MTAEVWGTQGLNLCRAESWEALDPDSIQAEHEAMAIKMNGPRYGLADASAGFELPDAEVRTYAELEMKQVAGSPTCHDWPIAWRSPWGGRLRPAHSTRISKRVRMARQSSFRTTWRTPTSGDDGGSHRRQYSPGSFVV